MLSALHFPNAPTTGRSCQLAGYFAQLAIFLTWLLLLSSFPVLAQTTITRYVSITGTTANPATALSWASSTTDLQGAINASQPGDQVWVAAGIYKPTSTTARDVSFSMKNGVAIYGGFVGNETDLGQRPVINPVSDQPSSSTLSGEIGDPNSTTDNSYHVISNPSGLTTTAVLDGFVITMGNARGSYPPYIFGGGVYNDCSWPGKFCSPSFRNCLFRENQALTEGGAMYNFGYNGDSSPQLTNCVFQSNTAGQGGAMCNFGLSGNSNPQLTNCSFESNTASLGGAIYNNGRTGNSSPQLNRCWFRSNQSVYYGGAMFNDGMSGNCIPQLTNCSFHGNTASLGGAIYSDGQNNGHSNPHLTNCTFQNNAAFIGGAIFNFAHSDNSSLQLINCSFQSNRAIYSGGVMNSGDSDNTRPQLTNCVLFNNGGSNSFYNSYTASVSATYSLFDNTDGVDVSGPGNLTTAISPFASATSVALAVGSRAINAGNPYSQTVAVGPYSATALPVTDLAGNSRIIGCRVDMGAVESDFGQNFLASVQDGPWSDPNTWSCKRVPMAGELVWIQHLVTVPGGYTAQAQSLVYRSGGRLVYQDGGRLQLGQ